jgi:hypothetical protein
MDIIHGDLALSRDAKAAVIFAHGSGSSRHSPRNRFVAHILQQGGIATLLVDLLTPGEERIDERTRNIASISACWQTDSSASPIGFGNIKVSRTCGWATSARAREPQQHSSRPRSDRTPLMRSSREGDGRTLPRKALSRVVAPTLFIVGERDYEVLLLNQEASRNMNPPATIEIVPSATHLFEEAGALEQVATLGASLVPKEPYSHQRCLKRLCRAGQQIANFVVSGLREAVVPLTDSDEWLRSDGANGLLPRSWRFGRTFHAQRQERRQRFVQGCAAVERQSPRASSTPSQDRHPPE